VTVDTACSSSLVALHLAAGALRSGECDLALAGGVMVMATPAGFIGLAGQGGFAADGRCKSFSSTADGTGWSEGVAVLALQRLPDAIRDGRPVLAVITGSAVNQDGASNGLTAPNGPSQQRVIRQALANAGLAPRQVDLVEAHGTGTKLGDPIEAQALLATYGQDRAAGQPLYLGSVKSNIGHAQAAAGAAAVIKAVLAIQRGVMPRTLHVDEPTPVVDWEAGQVALLTAARPWPQTGAPRRAAVSSFGISGTNAHLIIEQAPELAANPAPEDAPGGGPAGSGPAGPVPLVVSARTEAALAGQAARLADWLADSPELPLADLGHSLATTRSAFPYRAAAVAASHQEARDKLAALAAGQAAPGLARGYARPQSGRHGAGAGTPVVFVFPGQGAQWAGMGAELLRDEPAFAGAMAECAAALVPWTHWSVLDVIRQVPDAPSLDRVDVVQPALWAVMVSLARLWQSYGVTPAAVAGHSQGEIAAAVIADGLSLTDAAAVIALRSQLMAAHMTGRNGMASIAEPEQRVQARLGRLVRQLSIAAVNGPGQVVVAGQAQALDELIAGCQADGVRARRIAVDYASHSRQVEVIRDQLLEALGHIRPKDGRVPFYSAVTGGHIATGGLDAEYWYRNLREQVRFETVIRALAASGHQAFLEVSPHPVLSLAVTETLAAAAQDSAAAGSDPAVLGTLRRGEGDRRRFLTSLAEAQVHGTAVDWAAVFPGAAQVALPTYAFDRQRYWLSRSFAAGGGDAASLGLDGAGHPILAAGVAMADAGGYLFTGQLSARTHPWIGEHLVMGAIIVPGTGFVEMAVRAARQAGCDLVEELTLEAPLMLPEQGARQLQLSVGPPDHDGRRSLSIHSRQAAGTGAGEEAGSSEEQAWLRHATGVLGVAPASGEAPSSELTVWPPAGADAVDLSDFYDRAALGGLEYGPRFRGLRAAWQRGNDIFAELALPQENRAEGAEFLLHPGLFDAALQATALGDVEAGKADEDAGKVRLPFAWRGVRVHATGASVLRARLSATPGGVAFQLADGTGAPVATVDSLATRPIEPGQLKTAPQEHADSLFHLDWVPVTAPAAPDPGWHWVTVGGVPAGGAAGAPPAAYRDLSELRDSLAAGGTVPGMVAFLCEITGGDDATPLVDTAGSAHALAEGTLRLLHEWLADERFANTRLAVLTSGAVAAGEADEVPGLAAATVWGLLRSAQSEHPGRFLLVDVDGTDESRAQLPAVLAGAEEQVVLREGTALTPRLARTQAAAAAAPPLDGGGSILITGGTGLLGGLIARHLAARQPGHLFLLLSRRGPVAPGVAALAADLSAAGAAVRIVACDAADRGELAAVVGAIPAGHPLTAVLHAAGVLDDGVITSLTTQRLASVLQPKVDAAVNLHQLTLDAPLSAFVLFSSAAGVLGSAGQGSYAAANAFLDALAQRRRATGRPGTALAWGFWAQASGMTGHLQESDLRKMRAGGFLPLTAAQGLALFDLALFALDTGTGTTATGQAAVLPMRLDFGALRRMAAAGHLPPLMRGLVRAPAPRAADAGGAGGITLAQRLAGLPPEEGVRVVLDFVRAHAAAVLGHASPDAVSPAEGFKSLGFDSLTAVDLRNRLNQATGLRLPPTLVFDYPTPAELASHLAAAIVPERATLTAPVFAEITRLEGLLSGVGPADEDRMKITMRLHDMLAKWGDTRAAGEQGAASRNIDSASDDEIFELIGKEFGIS
jgi:acyl transferase domain-containing protein/acyl carrier protein